MKKWILCTAASLALFGAAVTAEARPPAGPPHDPPGAGAPRHPGPHHPNPPHHPAPPPHKTPPPPPPHDYSPFQVEINL